MHCQSCNERLPLSARACFACGAPVQREPAKPAEVEPSYPFRARINQTTPLRDRPYASARRTGFLDAGQTVSVVDARWGFLQVETDGGQRGFIEPHVIVQTPDAGARSVPLPADAPLRATDSAEAPEKPAPARFPEGDGAPMAGGSAEMDRSSTHVPQSEPDQARMPRPLRTRGNEIAPAAARDEQRDGFQWREVEPQATTAARPDTPPAPAAGTANAATPVPAPAIRALIPADARDVATPGAANGGEQDGSAVAERRAAGRRRRAASTPAERLDGDPASAPLEGDLPFNIPFLIGESVRFRAVFLYNPDEDQALVITNRRLIITGGTIGKLPRVLHLDEVEAVRLQDSGTGSTNGEGNLHITMTGMRGALHVGGVYMAHRVRNEILAACTDLLRAQATELPQRKTS